ncbi:MAG: TorF family putative porin [Steroidobacteraceae bacterium]
MHRRNSRIHLLAGLMSCLALPALAHARTSWGGSLGVTTDYLVRGISRSNHEPSLEAELHISGESGWMASVFTSTTRIAPGESRDAELGALLGYAWNWNDDWSSRITASHYSYPWNDLGTAYDYNEFSAELGYQGWLSFDVVYSPDAVRYTPDEGLIAVAARSAEVNLQSPAWHRLSFSAGLGYSSYGGPDGEDFAYWSTGCSLDLAPVTLSVGFIDTQAAARDLYYGSAARRRWMAAVLWRF